MADDLAFPTAILPTRPGALAERFDQLARRIGDPLVKMFVLSAAGATEETQLRASAELLPYRYTKLRAQDVNINANGSGPVNIQINMGAPPPQDVDPLG